MTNKKHLEDICHQFSFEGSFQKASPYGDGHINDTYKVTYVDQYEEPVNYILQRVNHLIFKNTVGLMENIENVTSYLCDMITEEEQLDGYEVLELVKTTDNKSFYVDSDGNYWRSYVFVEDATGYTFATDKGMLYEAGKAFGQFQRMLKDYPVASLHETIKDFHHTERRFETFEKVLKEDPHKRSEYCRKEIDFVLARKGIASTIVDALGNGEIPYRVTHNDTKLNNVLLDDKTGSGRCVIDLDTVMPGSALYDFGDAIRSCGSTAAEDEEDLSLLKLDIERYEAYTSGFLKTIGTSLTEREFELLPVSAILMTLECGVRFLTDYLDGDNYFKVHKDKHNLIRAKNQFKFVMEMEKNIDSMQEIVKNCRHATN